MTIRVISFKRILHCVAATSFLFACGCRSDGTSHQPTRQSSISMAIRLEPNGNIYGDQYRKLEDADLENRFSRLKSSHPQLIVAINVSDSSACSVKTISSAVSRIESLIPSDFRHKVTIRVLAPFDEGGFALEYLPYN